MTSSSSSSGTHVTYFGQGPVTYPIVNTPEVRFVENKPFVQIAQRPVIPDTVVSPFPSSMGQFVVSPITFPVVPSVTFAAAVKSTAAWRAIVLGNSIPAYLLALGIKTKSLNTNVDVRLYTNTKQNPVTGLPQVPLRPDNMLYALSADMRAKLIEWMVFPNDDVLATACLMSSPLAFYSRGEWSPSTECRAPDLINKDSWIGDKEQILYVSQDLWRGQLARQLLDPTRPVTVDGQAKVTNGTIQELVDQGVKQGLPTHLFFVDALTDYESTIWQAAPLSIRTKPIVGLNPRDPGGQPILDEDYIYSVSWIADSPFTGAPAPAQASPTQVAAPAPVAQAAESSAAPAALTPPGGPVVASSGGAKTKGKGGSARSDAGDLPYQGLLKDNQRMVRVSSSHADNQTYNTRIQVQVDKGFWRKYNAFDPDSQTWKESAKSGLASTEPGVGQTEKVVYRLFEMERENYVADVYQVPPSTNGQYVISRQQVRFYTPLIQSFGTFYVYLLGDASVDWHMFTGHDLTYIWQEMDWILQFIKDKPVPSARDITKMHRYMDEYRMFVLRSAERMRYDIKWMDYCEDLFYPTAQPPGRPSKQQIAAENPYRTQVMEALGLIPSSIAARRALCPLVHRRLQERLHDQSADPEFWRAINRPNDPTIFTRFWREDGAVPPSIAPTPAPSNPIEVSKLTDQAVVLQTPVVPVQSAVIVQQAPVPPPQSGRITQGPQGVLTAVTVPAVQTSTATVVPVPPGRCQGPKKMISTYRAGQPVEIPETDAQCAAREATTAATAAQTAAGGVGQLKQPYQYRQLAAAAVKPAAKLVAKALVKPAPHIASQRRLGGYTQQEKDWAMGSAFEFNARNANPTEYELEQKARIRAIRQSIADERRLPNGECPCTTECTQNGQRPEYLDSWCYVDGKTCPNANKGLLGHWKYCDSNPAAAQIPLEQYLPGFITTQYIEKPPTIDFSTPSIPTGAAPPLGDYYAAPREGGAGKTRHTRRSHRSHRK